MIEPTRPGEAVLALAFVVLALLGALVVFGFLCVFLLEPFADYLSDLADRLRLWRQSRNKGPTDP